MNGKNFQVGSPFLLIIGHSSVSSRERVAGEQPGFYRVRATVSTRYPEFSFTTTSTQEAGDIWLIPVSKK
jgi:hypothetical protein